VHSGSARCTRHAAGCGTRAAILERGSRCHSNVQIHLGLSTRAIGAPAAATQRTCPSGACRTSRAAASTPTLKTSAQEALDEGTPVGFEAKEWLLGDCCCADQTLRSKLTCRGSDGFYCAYYACGTAETRPTFLSATSVVGEDCKIRRAAGNW